MRVKRAPMRPGKALQTRGGCQEARGEPQRLCCCAGFRTRAQPIIALLRQCPLRYVLRDELVNLCVELACSGGAQLATRFDLAHFRFGSSLICTVPHGRRLGVTLLLCWE